MPSAYILISSDVGSEENIIKEIRGLDNVKVEGTYGVYDMIVKVESNSMEELKNTITSKIRKIPQVRSTITLMVIEGQG